MPYIKVGRRLDLLDPIGPFDKPKTPGELNFCLTWHLLHTPLKDLEYAVWNEVEEYLSVRAESYALYNEVVGALECCRREFIRRRGTSTEDDLQREAALLEALNRLGGPIAAYEDTKIEENGDVY